MTTKSYKFLGKKLVPSGVYEYPRDAFGPELLAREEANTLLFALAREAQLFWEAQDFLVHFPNRPLEPGYHQDQWDAATATIANAAPEAQWVSSRTGESLFEEIWEASDAWGPRIDVSSNGDVRVYFDASIVTSADLEYEKQLALVELRKNFQKARDKGTVVTINGQNYAIQTNPIAQSEIRSLQMYLSNQPSGTTQTIRTRAGDTIVVDLAGANFLLSSIEVYISAVWANDAAKGQEIDAATTLAEVRAVDVTAGWP